MSKTTWLILGFIGLLMFYPEKKKQRASPASDDLHGLNLSGRLRSCESYFETTDKNGKKIHRCFIYAPTCGPKKCKEDFSAKKGLSGVTATCQTFKKTPYGKIYCAKYVATCGADQTGCRTKPVEVPGREPKLTKKEKEKLQKSNQKEIQAIAKGLADEANATLDQNKHLMKRILDYGGIAPYKSGFLSEEYKDIPTKYKRKDGISIDELAQELGTNERDLVDEISQAEQNFLALKQMRGGKTARRFKKEDFINEAADRLASGRGMLGKMKAFRISNLGTKIYGEDFFSPKQKELFPELRRELVLKAEDTATSDEPLEACLERKGWDLRKVRKYQESIADKMTPDMFGKMQKLTGTEVMLQENIQKCLERLRK